MQIKVPTRRTVTDLVCRGIPLYIFILSALLVYRFAIIDMDAHHTGLMYKTALDVAAGKVMFRETFTQYGALTAYVQALFIRIFGERITSIHLATALCYAADYTLLYLVVKKLTGTPTALAATGITLFLAPYFFWEFHPWSSVFALLFMLLSLYSLLWAIEHAGKVGLLLSALSGLCAALTFWARQPVGLVTILAGLLCIGGAIFLARQKKPIRVRFFALFLLFVAGVAAGILLFLLPILANGAMGDFVQQSLSGMLNLATDRAEGELYGGYGFVGLLLYDLFLAPFRHLWTPAVFNVFWAFLPASALALAVWEIVRLLLASRKKNPDFTPTPKELSLLFYCIFAVAEWHQYYPVDCLRHWYWGAFLCVPAMILLAGRLLSLWMNCRPFAFLREGRRPLIALVLVCLLCFGTNVGYHAVRGGIRLVETTKWGRYENAYYHHLDGLYISGEMADYYDRLFEAMHTLQTAFPDKNVVNTTENGIYAVFGENFCPMFTNCGDFFYPDYPTWQADYIRAQRPIVIGAEAPQQDYVLYRAMDGYDGDPTAEFHRMPANIYIPAELTLP
ncbi:MAG: glycosyltransferase family 39 protein [Clostridia bacterium]|nr:glycosyltransferase family 39 protein [Clostridia bacterium]